MNKIYILGHANQPVESSSPCKQQGAAALVMSLVLIAVLTIVGITSSRIAILETRMTTNAIEKQKSRIAAESALSYALAEISNFKEIDFLETCNRPGIFDLRATARSTCPNLDYDSDDQGSTETVSANNKDQWISHATDWSWGSSILRTAMLNKLSAEGSPVLYNNAERANPMKLSSTPQYAIGIHELTRRPGTENTYCFPVTIIAAAKGGIDQAQTLIELKTIPQNGCTHQDKE